MLEFCSLVSQATPSFSNVAREKSGTRNHVRDVRINEHGHGRESRSASAKWRRGDFAHATIYRAFAACLYFWSSFWGVLLDRKEHSNDGI